MRPPTVGPVAAELVGSDRAVAAETLNVGAGLLDLAGSLTVDVGAV